MRQDEIDDLRQRFPVGATVVGSVAVRAPFGVFIDIATGVRALLEISYMGIDSKGYGNDDPYTVGSEIRARVLAVYPHDGQIRLTQRGHPPTAA